MAIRGDRMTVEQDEILLRKKARRRLVGAVLLTLILVLSLPLVLEDPSQPLRDGPEIVIPAPTQVEPPRAATVPDSLPDDSVGEEVLPLEAGAASSSPAATPAPTQPANPPTPPTSAVPAEPGGGKSPAPVAPTGKAAATSAASAERSPASSPASEKPVAAPGVSAKPPAPAARAYLLQLGLFKERANADRIASQAAALGLTPVVAETAAGSWRVGVGPYADKAEALSARDRLRDAGLAVVLKAP